jgi:radical SAM protein with 4Fe4S-binding SPASM domain
MVNWDGKVQVCCPDIGSKLIIGDMKVHSIMEIWNSFEAKQIRKDLKSKKSFEKDPCKNCSSFESYKGFSPKWTS